MKKSVKKSEEAEVASESLSSAFNRVQQENEQLKQVLDFATTNIANLSVEVLQLNKAFKEYEAMHKNVDLVQTTTISENPADYHPEWSQELIEQTSESEAVIQPKNNTEFLEVMSRLDDIKKTRRHIRTSLEESIVILKELADINPVETSKTPSTLKPDNLENSNGEKLALESMALQLEKAQQELGTKSMNLVSKSLELSDLKLKFSSLEEKYKILTEQYGILQTLYTTVNERLHKDDDALRITQGELQATRKLQAQSVVAEELTKTINSLLPVAQSIIDSQSDSISNTEQHIQHNKPSTTPKTKTLEGGKELKLPNNQRR